MPVDVTDIKRYFEVKKQYIEQLLDKYLPPVEHPPSNLHAAMRYSVLAPGKRLRPILAWAAFEYCNGDTEIRGDALDKVMAALEMIHTYSLIHDDLPCMDDDDLRRGIPTCHKKYGEAIAVLAGDALHDVAFGLLAETGFSVTVKELADAIGTAGMIGGQTADVEAEGRQVAREEVIEIHRLKTAALIRCSVRQGAIIAEADGALLSRLSEYGEKIGLAFQIIDDILDIKGNQDLLGKQIGSDDRKQKATYPSAVGIKQAQHDAAVLIEEAISCTGESDDNMLAQIARYIGHRTN